MFAMKAYSMLYPSRSIKRIRLTFGERTQKNVFRRRGMRTSTVEAEVPTTVGITVTDDTLSVDLSDGRTISAPLARFPRLAHETAKERRNWRFIGKGHGIHWLDEDVSVENLLLRLPSREPIIVPEIAVIETARPGGPALLARRRT